jgi:hypothetical protein
MITGQMNFTQNQTKKIIAIVWPINVALKFTAFSSLDCVVHFCSGYEASSNERIRKGEEQSDTNADHSDRVEQRDNEEHLRSEHRSQFRLTRGAFEEAATEQAHSNAYAEPTEPNQ